MKRQRRPNLSPLRRRELAQDARHRQIISHPHRFGRGGSPAFGRRGDLWLGRPELPWRLRSIAATFVTFLAKDWAVRQLSVAAATYGLEARTALAIDVNRP